jgi:hypothetical protein
MDFHSAAQWLDEVEGCSMNMQVTDWAEHYKAVRNRIARVSVPARIRLAVQRYEEPIGPEHIYKVIYDEPIGPMRVSIKFDPVRVQPTMKGRFEAIRDEELEKAGITVEQFLGDSRRAVFTEVRRKIWVRASKETQLSIANIGRLSHKDHSSVLKAILRHTELSTGVENPSLAENRRKARARHLRMQQARARARLQRGG